MASKWFIKLYTKDILASYDYQKMTLEEKGLYTHILILLADSEDGEIMFDEELIARSAGCSVRKFRVIFAKISSKFQLRKLNENQTKIYNSRMKSEVEARQGKSQKYSENGAKGGRPRVSFAKAIALANEKQSLTYKEKEKEKEINIKPKTKNLCAHAREGAEVDIQPKQKIPNCPYGEIVKLYHEVLPECTACRELNETRKRQIFGIWKSSEKWQDLEQWRKYFEFIKRSDFLTGRVTSPGHNPAIFNLEWFTKPSNFIKIREGTYHRPERKGNDGHTG